MALCPIEPDRQQQAGSRSSRTARHRRAGRVPNFRPRSIRFHYSRYTTVACCLRSLFDSGRADAVLLTVRLRRNARPLAQQALQMLDQLGIRPIGIVVNGITNSRSYDYRYGQYGYEEKVEA